MFLYHLSRQPSLFVGGGGQHQGEANVASGR